MAAGFFSVVVAALSVDVVFSVPPPALSLFVPAPASPDGVGSAALSLLTPLWEPRLSVL